ncbi:MAG: hypothetical protein ACOZQL_20985 [Myxococcota bacterium]
MLPTIVAELFALLWPLLAGGAGLTLLALLTFAVMGGHYGQLVLLFAGPVALGVLLLAVALRALSLKLRRSWAESP